MRSGWALVVAAAFASSALAADPTITIPANTIKEVTETVAFDIEASSFITVADDDEDNAGLKVTFTTGSAVTGLDLTACTDAVLASCKLKGTLGSGAATSDVTVTATVTDASSATATATFVLRPLIKATLAQSSSDVEAGTLGITVTFSSAISAGFSETDLTATNAECGTATAAGGGTSYTSTCTATGAGTAVSVSLAKKLAADSLTQGYAAAADTLSMTYAPKLTAVAITDGSDAALLTGNVAKADSVPFAIKVKYTFSGKMTGFTAAKLGLTMPSGVTAPTPTVSNSGATDSNKAITYTAAMPTGSATFTIVLADGDIAVTTADGVSNSHTVKIDESAPTVTAKTTPLILMDNAAPTGGAVNVLSEMITAISDDTTATGDLALTITATKVSGEKDVATVFDLTGCTSKTHTQGCTITGKGTGGLIPSDSVGVFEFSLAATDKATRATTAKFFVVIRANITATTDATELAGLTKPSLAGAFGIPGQSYRRTVTANLNNICTSSSGNGDIAVSTAVTDVSGTQASTCTAVDGKQSTGTPKLTCEFSGPGSISITVTCKDEWGTTATITGADASVAAASKDLEASLTGIWTIKANVAPTVSVAGTFQYTENDGAKKLNGTSGLNMALSDTGETKGTKLVVALQQCVAGFDVLGLDASDSAFPAASLEANVSSDNCTVTVTPKAPAKAASHADFDKALALVSFKHVSDNPSTENPTSIMVTFTDNAADDASATAAEFVSTNQTFAFRVREINDAPKLLVHSTAVHAAAFDASTTTLTIAENAADGACIQDGSGNDVVIYVEDIDAIQHGSDTNTSAGDDDIRLVMVDSDTWPDAKYFSMAPAANVTTANTTTTASGLVPGKNEKFVARNYKVCMATRFTVSSNGGLMGPKREAWRFLDFENLPPNKFANMTSNNRLPLQLRLSSPAEATAQVITIWYKVTDVADEAPHFFLPTSGVIGIDGLRTNFTGVQNPVPFYRSSLKANFTLQSSNLDASNGNINADSVTTNFYPETSPAVKYMGARTPVDFIHGQYNKVGFKIADVAVNPGGTGSLVNPTFSLVFKGQVTKDASATAVGTPGTEAIAAGAKSTLGDNFPATSNASFTFAFDQNATHISFAGMPIYDNTYELSNQSTSRKSPAPKRLHFELHAVHPGTGKSSFKTFRNIYIDVEIRGCMDVRASWTNHTGFMSPSTDLGTLPTKAQLTQYDTAAWTNLAGNFNDNASIPALCTFPPRAVSAGAAATFTVPGARSETTAAALETALGATPTDAEVESARGFVALDVPTGATTATVPIEVAGVTPEVAKAVAPPTEGAIVDADLTLKLGPCGQQFEKPLTVCVFVGKSLPNRYFSMFHASAVNCNDQSLGYADFQPTTGNTYNPTTGKVCGEISSFSVVAGVSLPTPVFSQLDARYLVPGGGCPSDCSGHGYCKAYARCECFEGFGGYDCSSRTCPSSESWASDSEVPRASEECSGRGECDGSSGECQCFDGFEGPACERVGCLNDCSGHGRCKYISELAEPAAASYSVWDASRIQTCECDPGYFGSDCGMRNCPFGDDPQTHCDASANKKQTLTLSFPIAVSAATAGSYPFSGTLAATQTDWAIEHSSLVMGWTTATGSSYFTSPVHDLLKATGAPTSAQLKASVKSALKNLPNFVADDAVIITDATTAGASRAVTVELAGAMNSGDGHSVSCPPEYHCPFPGCRPRFQQLRMTAKDVPSSDVVLAEPLIVTPPASAQGVEVQVTIANTASYGGSSVKTISASTCPITVAGTTMSQGTCTSSLSARPVPTRNFKTKHIEVGAGVSVTLSSVTPTDGVYKFYFVMGSCSVVTDRPAGAARESIECAGRGVCDRSSGTCDCFDGFQGYNCAARSIIM